ncbi:TPR-like protein [Zopfia rhizophila CBS 207.26]|uniref:TPR-like protein n=1 Tax=Zopfia rhizophila CBS 207.26 TaxID=1314779 RepID=A0A6A6DB64_9PEZI|nr:TPR-like protein [Zopfia rhizophila CBS 207.26]
MIIGRGAISHIRYMGDDEAAPDIKKKLDAVAENEDEFAPWEALVTTVESLEGGLTRNSSPSAIELVRNVYDCLLAKFCLFFGYWKKYADLEFSIGGTETAEMVYERGVSCIPNSVDLWANYCAFKVDTCHDPDVIRELFERGAKSVGLDYMSHPFWDKYIEFEERVDGKENITKILERVIHIPTYQYSRYFERFRNWGTSRPIEELVDAELLGAFRAAVHNENLGQPRSELEVDRQLRLKIDAYHTEIFHRTQTETTKRWSYEQGIKRAYFHVTELDEEQIVNWRKYLDFEETEGDYTRTAFLYERCLVACALYEEFWLRYARWLLGQGKEEDARIIYMKASTIFVPISRPTIRLHWARCEEKLGRVDVARAIHEAILDVIPNHEETMISYAGIERRHKDLDAAITLLENYIRSDQVDIYAKGKLAAEQARLLWQCKGSPEEARKHFQNTSRSYLDVKAFWIKYLQFEIALPAGEETEADSHARIKAVHDRMRMEARLPPQTMKDLSHYYMEYLLDRGGKEAASEYMELDKEVNGYVSSTPISPLPPSSLPFLPAREEHSYHTDKSRKHLS